MSTSEQRPVARPVAPTRSRSAARASGRRDRQVRAAEARRGPSRPAGSRRSSSGRESAARWITTALLVVAVGASLHALDGIFAGASWQRASIAAASATLVGAALVRQLSRRAWLPTAVVSVLALLGVLTVYGTPEASQRLVPTLDSPHDLAQLLGNLGQLLRDGVAPMAASRPIEAMLVIAAVLIAILVDISASWLRSPALVPLVITIAWSPSIAIGIAGAGWAPIVATAAAWLVVPVIDKAQQQTSRQRTATVTTAAGAIAVAIVAAVAIATPLSHIPVWSTVDISTGGSGTQNVSLSSDLDLRNDLGARSGNRLFSYQVTSESATGLVPTAIAAGPMRVFSMATFDGTSWSERSDPPLVEGAPNGVAPDDVDYGAAGVETQGATIDVTIDALRQSTLPILTYPQIISSPQRWASSPIEGSVRLARATAQGMTYSLQVEVPKLTPDLLRSVGSGQIDEIGFEYLDVPDTVHAGDVASLAREITAGDTTAYDRALALQEYFRDTSTFTYDATVDLADSSDAVWDFLNNRRGYCVQFASSMVIMSRTLGIPARLAVGFLPGLPDGDTYVVAGKQAHAWPELYFDEVGWVRFEPTPAIQTGAPPRWSDPLISDQPSASPTPTSTSQPTPRPTSSSAPSRPQDGTAADESRTPWLPIAGGASGVVLLVAATLAVLLLRRRRRRTVVHDAEDVWGQIRAAALSAGYPWNDAHSPRTASNALRSAVLARRGTGLDDAADVALTEVTAAVESMRYARPRPEEVDMATLQRLGAVIVNDVQIVTAGGGASEKQ